MHRNIIAALFALVLLSASGAEACSPPVDYATRPLKDKILQAEVAFIGKVEEATEDHTTFRIGAPGQNAAAKGETMTFKHQMYGTCGGHTFAAGEVWLFAGDGPFTATRIVQPEDMDAAFDDVVARLTQDEQAPQEQE